MQHKQKKLRKKAIFGQAGVALASSDPPSWLSFNGSYYGYSLPGNCLKVLDFISAKLSVNDCVGRLLNRVRSFLLCCVPNFCARFAGALHRMLSVSSALMFIAVISVELIHLSDSSKFYDTVSFAAI